MNKQLRKQIEHVINALEEQKNDLEMHMEAMQEIQDNTPENLQSGDRYEKRDTEISNLDDAISSLDDAINYLNESIEN